VAQRDPILSVLGPNGLLSRSIPGYEHRPQQIQMARLVRQVLDERRYAVIEAGTGTGKTLGYIVPAILSGRRVVVSTATKTLQEQIITKDLPVLREAVAMEFKATVMKGRSNYLCLARLERARESVQLDFATKHEARAFERIRSWAATTETGDRAELDLPENLGLWRELTSTPDTCPGSRCPSHPVCFVTRMRERGAESDLIIVNHHLFFADLMIRGAGKAVLPGYEAVVFDEAHALEDVATEFFGVGASDWRVSDLAHDARRELDDERSLNVETLAARIEVLSKHLFDEVSRLLPKGTDAAARLTAESARPLKEPAEELIEGLRAFKARIAPIERLEVQALARRADELAGDLGFLVQVREPGFVFWAQSRARSTLLRSAPIDVAEELRVRLYPKVDTAVFTSATLATEGTLDFAKERLGLLPRSDGEALSVEDLVLDSPFDYARQASLYAPRGLPDPSDSAFVPAAAEEILRLCEITGGRAFALFTSLRNMSEAHRLLSPRLPFQVLLQGERPKAALIAEFRARPSVLFAAQSFWEGVDVAGDALSLVIIDKLPFASPADPVVAARVELLKERERDAFAEYQIPQAAIALRQGFGRLIRTRRDRGIVAVLDRRLTTRSYGKSFLESLPPCPRFSQRTEVERWWRGEVAAAPRPPARPLERSVGHRPNLP